LDTTLAKEAARTGNFGLVSLDDTLPAVVANNDQTVTLAGGDSTSVDFSWIPTTVGDHRLTARAARVPGELTSPITLNPVPI